MSIWSSIFSNSSNFNRKEEDISFKERYAALKNLPRFFRLIWQSNKYMTIGNVLLRIIQAAVPLAMLYVGKLIIDEVIGLTQIGESANMTYIWTLIAVEFGLALMSDLLSRGITLLDALLGDLFANKTSVMLIEHAAQLDMQQFEDSAFYDKMEMARRQTIGRVVLMSQVLSQLQDFITIIFLSAGLLVFSPWLMVLLALAVIPAFLGESHFNSRSYSLVRNWTPERRELDYLRFIGASDTTAKEVKSFGLSGFLKERFAHLADKYYEANKGLAVRRAAWGSIFNSLGAAGYYAAYVVIIIQTVGGLLTVGDLTFLAGSFSRLRGLLQGMLTRFSTIAQSALYLQDFFDFLEMQPSITAPLQALPFPTTIQQGFVFEKVSFKYPKTEKWVLKDLSFTLHPGEKLALVGENGAGKTTLVKLLSRLYDPTEGRILLDGRDLREYDLAKLRQAIGVIFQDFVRFQMTVSENIAIGKIEEKQNDPLIVESAQKSLADAVVERLPDGYEQMLGRRFANGIEISGGEWQKIALGRAYMRDAQLLILDEPTAALDARSEFEVFQRFADLTKGKMAVLISHRFSTVRMADRILVLKNGQNAEIGSHEALIANNGIYAELFNLQAMGYR